MGIQNTAFQVNPQVSPGDPELTPLQAEDKSESTVTTHMTEGPTWNPVRMNQGPA